jgi:RHS repeat-associated protein
LWENIALDTSGYKFSQKYALCDHLGAESANKYQYNSKERNDDFGLGWNDYGARFYDPAVGKWNAVDPLAKMRNNYTPYHYVSDNPVNRIDTVPIFLR